MIFKSALNSLQVVKDYKSFHKSYYEVSNFSSFLYYRLFPSKLGRRYWPINKNSEARGSIYIGKGARVGHRPNCIIQGRERLFIGDYVEIGPNTVIISGNHSVYDQSELIKKRDNNRRSLLDSKFMCYPRRSCIRATHHCRSRQRSNKEFS